MKIPQHRVRETDKGFVCETIRRGAFKDTWIPFITWSGLDEAYPFSSRMNAENALLMEIKKNYILHI
jgi:hypothetical protein